MRFCVGPIRLFRQDGWNFFYYWGSCCRCSSLAAGSQSEGLYAFDGSNGGAGLVNRIQTCCCAAECCIVVAGNLICLIILDGVHIRTALIRGTAYKSAYQHVTVGAHTAAVVELIPASKSGSGSMVRILGGTRSASDRSDAVRCFVPSVKSFAAQ